MKQIQLGVAAGIFPTHMQILQHSLSLCRAEQSGRGFSRNQGIGTRG